MVDDRYLIGLGAVLALVVAGCVAGPTGPPVSTDVVPEDADSEAGDGGYELSLRVLDEPGGPAIENAPVVAYWGDEETEAEGSFEISGEADGESGSAEGVVRADVRPSTPPTDTTLTARTGPDGAATLHVPTNHVIGLVVSAAGHTEEWIPRAATGDDGASGTASLPVYHRSLSGTTEDSWDIAGASPGTVTGSDYDWNPEEVPWGHNAEAREGYVERLAELRVTVNWTNGPSGAGDLAAAAGAGSGQPDLLADDSENAGAGEQQEQLVADVGQVEEAGWPDSTTLYVGPATDSVYAAPMNLDYTVHTEARFSPFASPTGGSGGSADSPGPGLLVVPLSAAAALVLGRRR